MKSDRHIRLVPEEVIRDLIFGPLFYRWLIAGRTLDHGTCRGLVERASLALRPKVSPDRGDRK